MRKIFLLPLLFIAVQAFATIPFSVSGQKIEAIFESELIWQTVSEPVNSLEMIKYNQLSKTTTFLIRTDSCNILVDVQENGTNRLIPEWEVIKADTSGCE